MISEETMTLLGQLALIWVGGWCCVGVGWVAFVAGRAFYLDILGRKE